MHSFFQPLTQPKLILYENKINNLGIYLEGFQDDLVYSPQGRILSQFLCSGGRGISICREAHSLTFLGNLFLLPVMQRANLNSSC